MKKHLISSTLSRAVSASTGRTTWRPGHGPGYAAAYSYTGTWRTRPVEGSAYLEWIDVQPA
ncbi:hypothetical protein [Mycolicibacterium aubagnense]|uniref:Uncharacterized protein n=1 Tax=Mycolicibacterium aubagnense TaxID=319707 RepID=A0ABM7IFN9_9MYCO|nr:hypothetical protein [Mycolicibacterium aubagnense]TLH70719.1 hypothetical protein C1S80_00155 [Mycolicibacterium aubagnense]WGI32779.1 hypothetical protein QDT91_27140 [Mycolicibacterium aubagnense]BBX85569.1 hypothetical protein MAUB_34420 [Mycolicibacterium aubagnense]